MPIVFLAVIFMNSSCQKEVFEDDLNILMPSSFDQVVSKSSYPPECEDPYLVRDSDIDAYVHYHRVSDRMEEKGDIIDVKPYVSEGQCFFYVINFENGWEILSADKRGPIILAQGNEDSFSMEAAIPPVQTWMNCLADDIDRRRNDPRYYDKASEEVLSCEENSLNIWRAITADIESIQERNGTKAHGDPIPNPDYPGHWELDSVHQWEETSGIPHLMNTVWNQIDPYNLVCPYKSDWSERAPAGCTSIATSQVLYYLNRNFGVPAYGFSYGLCIGDIHNYYFDFSGWNSTVWDTMASTSTNNYAANLIAHVGHLLETTYGDSGSKADLENAASSALPFYGWNASFSSYDSQTAYSNLCAGYPVLFSANRWNPHPPLNLFSAHAWVIDGYVTAWTVTQYVYVWVYEVSDPEAPVPISTESYEVLTYSNYHAKYFRMNWGFGPSSFNNYDYAPNGDWGISGENPYAFVKKMVCDYEIIED